MGFFSTTANLKFKTRKNNSKYNKGEQISLQKPICMTQGAEKPIYPPKTRLRYLKKVK